MAFDWIFELKDSASGPAAKIAKELKGLDKGLTDVAGSAKGFDKGLDAVGDAQSDAVGSAKKLTKVEDALGKSLAGAANDTDDLAKEQAQLARSMAGVRGSISGATGAVDKYGASTGKASTSLKGFIGAMGPGAVAALTAVTAAATAAAAAILGTATAFAKGVVEATDFARTTRSSFGILLGSAEAGEGALADVRDIARETAMPLEEVRKTFGTLVATGMDTELAKDLAKMRADFMVIGEEAEAAFGKMTDAMAEGEVSISAFEDMAKNLGGRGVLGRALGFTQDELAETSEGVEALQARLKTLDPQEFLRTTVEVAKLRGELGATAKGAASFGQRLESLKETAFLDISREMGLTGESMDALLGKIEALTQSDEFKRFARSIGDAVYSMGLIFTDTAGFIVEHWDTIGPILKGTAIAAGLVFGVFALGAGMIVAPVLAAGAVIAGLVGAVVWLVDVVVSNIGKVPEAIGGAVTAAGEWISGLATSAYEWGGNIVDGLVNGITGSIGKAIDAARNLAGSVKNAVVGALGIASPSKEFAWLGEMTSLGFSEGMNDNAQPLEETAADAFAPPTPAAMADAVGSSGSGSGGGLTIIIESGAITISGGATEEQANMFRAKLTEAIEEIARGQGVDPDEAEAA